MRQKSFPLEHVQPIDCYAVHINGILIKCLLNRIFVVKRTVNGAKMAKMQQSDYFMFFSRKLKSISAFHCNVFPRIGQIISDRNCSRPTSKHISTAEK